MAVKEFLEKFDKKDILFSLHSAIILEERKLEKDFILDKLFDFESLEAEAKQNGTSVLIYEHTSKYHIVIVISTENGRPKIVTAFKSSKKIEKLLKRAKGTIMYTKRYEM